MDANEYEHESDCQDIADYGPEGYYPVVLGQKFNQGKYVVIQKLGWGHFSTVWLVLDQTTNQYSAMKIQRSKDTHAESALDELKILNELRQHENDQAWVEFLNGIQNKHPEDINAKLCRPLLLLDNFAEYGINGKHYCSVFELMGPNLLDLIQHYEFRDQRMPLWLVKKITVDVLLGLAYMHDHCNLIHTDLKPENIMIKLEEKEQDRLISNIREYTVKPISMKFLKNLHSSKNPKAKKKSEKKKLKKKQVQARGDAGGEKEKEEQSVEQMSEGQANNVPSVGNQIEVEPTAKPETTAKQEAQITAKQSSDNTILAEQGPNKQQAKEECAQQKSQMPTTVDMKILKWKNVQIELNKKLFFKVVDMGNTCFINHHYTEDIQTREYRSPQVILGYSYETTTDIWSLACTIFELLTNSFLFKPKNVSGISKDEDHLYRIIEVLGPLSKEHCLGGIHSRKFFNKKGKLLNGHPKQHARLHEILHEDYDYSLQDSVEIEQFLLPMLEIDGQKRITAKQCLESAWLWK